MCIAVGSTIGGYLPTLAGYSSFGVVSLLGSGVGSVVAVLVARRFDLDF